MATTASTLLRAPAALLTPTPPTPTTPSPHQPPLSSSFLPLPLHKHAPAALGTTLARKATPAAAPAPAAHRLAVSATAVPAAGRGSWSVGAPEGTVDLCIFPMWTMPLPTSSGSLNVFEPHLVALLQVVQQVAAGDADGTPAHFGVMPYDWVQREMQAREPDPASSTLPYFAPSTIESLERTFMGLGDDVVGCCCEVSTSGVYLIPASDTFISSFLLL